MKKLLMIIILILLLPFTINAQDYFPLPDSNARWKIVWFEPFPQLYSQHYDYFLNGDTIINDIIYHKIFKREIGISCSKDTIDNYYKGSYRNETMSKKVFYIPPYDQSEQLLYDFSLDVGDTVPQTFQNWLFPNLIVTEIDTFNYQNLFRRRFTYWMGPGPFGYSFYVIEGVGADLGLLEYFIPVENNYYLKCFHLNDTLAYLHQDDTTCVLETDTCIYTEIINPIEATKDIRVFSSNKHIIVESYSQDENLLVKIIDLHGRLVYECNMRSNITCINDDFFTSGLYFVLLIHGNQPIFLKKIIINH